jgi:hypothetical protein
MIQDLVVVDPVSSTSVDISKRTTRLGVSLSMTAVAQLTAEVEDPGLKLLENNVFSLRRLVTYKDVPYEVSAVEVRQGQSQEALTVELRSSKCQQLKRDKGQASFPRLSPTDFASVKALEFGMTFFGEATPAKGTIVRVKNDKTDESTWDVLKRLSSENQFYLFETDGKLFFTSGQFLTGKFAITAVGASPGFIYTPIYWNQDPPSTLAASGRVGFRCITCPSVRRSDDDSDAAQVDIQLQREDGIRLRPGMTILLEGVPTFKANYLVSEVRWNEGETSSISIAAVAPEVSTEQGASSASIDLTGGGFSLSQMSQTI